MINLLSPGRRWFQSQIVLDDVRYAFSLTVVVLRSRFLSDLIMMFYRVCDLRSG